MDNYKNNSDYLLNRAKIQNNLLKANNIWENLCFFLYFHISRVSCQHSFHRLSFLARLFIILPTKFHEGIFLSVLLTGSMSQIRNIKSTAMPMRQVMP